MLTMIDRRKLLNAGFRIFRRDELRKLIKECRGENLSWYKVGDYKSIAEMNRMMDSLLMSQTNIEED
ncbi:MAG: hypothetical protein EPN93_17300 [Spirochaetes bacterium]|nr:MAG: hypothetical protein EPN93_17300 [Spirochaetota bacterium]